jgi:hypothetical protein
MRYSYYRAIDSKEQFRYRFDSRLAISDDWSGRIAVRRELSGKERFVERSLLYKQNHGWLRRLEFGTLVERFGLGSVLGYRGKLLRFSGDLNNESFLYPDNGGFNGASFEIQPHGWRIRGLAGYARDSAIGLATFALAVEQIGRRIRPYFIWGGNRARHRVSGNSFDDLKFAGGIATNYHHGNAAVEYCIQADAGREAGALLAEGSHKISDTRLTYAGWWYGNAFVDLSSGGKGTDIRSETEFRELDFTLSSRRPGQRGAQVKGKIGLDHDTRLIGAIILARRNADSSNVQWLGGLERDLAHHWSVRGDYLQSNKKRDNADGNDDRFTRRVRAEVRFTIDHLTTRTYLAFSSTSSYGDYVSLFANVRLKVNDMMRGELWSNLSRFANGEIDYWYLYAKLSQQLATGYSVSVKLNHRYDRRATIHHSNAVSFEVEARW